jgi:glucosamine-6-phosphate deaminase
MRARALVLLATGKSKASCIAKVVNGPITTRLPASCLQLHPNVDLILDEAAASRIDGAR